MAWARCCVEYGGNDHDLNVDLLASASTPGGFEWHRFLMGRPFGITILQEGIVDLRLVWCANGVCLRVTTRARPPCHIIFRGNRAFLGI